MGSIIVWIIIIGAIISGISTCDGCDGCDGCGGCDGCSHEHELRYVSATAPTCYSDGNIEYWYCIDCYDRFSDSDGEDEIDNVSINRIGHSFGNWNPEVSATYSSHGTVGHYRCTYCSKIFDSNYSEITDTTLHNYGSWNDEIPPTCTTEGRLGYYHCSVCSKNFDAYKNEISSPVLSATGHYFGEWISEMNPTCTEPGTIGHYHCYTCEKDFDSNQNELLSSIISAMGHNYGMWIPEQSPTCDVEGAVGHYHCSSCEKNFDINRNELESITIAANGHSFGDWIEQTSATCTEDGVRGHYLCAVCNNYFDEYGYKIDSIVITSPGHSYGYWNNEVPATCVQDGTLGHYFCYTCEKYFDQEGNELESLVTRGGHDYVNGACSRCSQSDGLTYELVGDSYYITAFNDSYDVVNIPSTYNGLPVTRIGTFAFDSKSITSITIPDSVTVIDEYAFWCCKNLTSIVIPDSVVSIGETAFEECTSLTSVTIGSLVSEINDFAFEYCYKLVEVINKSALTITAGSSDYGNIAFYAKEVHNGESKIVNKDGYIFYTYDGVNYLLDYVGSETELTLPENYNGESYEIYSYAFYYRNDISSVTIPVGVISVGASAFEGCSGLTINCTAASQPDGWDSSWNPSGCTVIWGYVPEN